MKSFIRSKVNMPEAVNLASPDSKTIQTYFDQIADRYDSINTLLSLKIDERWRKQSLEAVYDPKQASVLDLGVGTGKFLKLFLDKKKWDKAVGLDFSEGMLAVARRDLGKQAEFVSGDFHQLPFGEDSFDLVVSSFTLRSVKKMDVFLREVFRILKPAGCVGFLCLTRPSNFFWKILYYPYLNFYLPLMGRLLSGSAEAYQFLSKSIQTFQEPEQTAANMRELGFRNVAIKRFTFGSATLIIGYK